MWLRSVGWEIRRVAKGCSTLQEVTRACRTGSLAVVEVGQRGNRSAARYVPATRGRSGRRDAPLGDNPVSLAGAVVESQT